MNINGLTNEEVNIRIQKNLVNYDTSVPTKSIKMIIKDNLITRFNILNLILGIGIILVGSYKNLLFLMVIICNTIISTIQEIRSKVVIDKLSLLSASKVKVIRNKKEIMIGINDIVLDDIIIFNSGDQIVVDSKIMKGEAEVNEAFITGEEEAIYKKEKDNILSGSFVVSGKIIAKVIHVGNDNYTAKISKEAKYIKNMETEMKKSFDKILKMISFVIFPLGIILFFKQLILSDYDITNTVITTTAAMVGMIPEGLILLTSTVLAVSIIRLSKYNVLVEELYAIEMLARIDTLCLDKTGTLTSGKMNVVKIIEKDSKAEEILNAICYYMDDNNQTSLALKKYFNNKTKYILTDKKAFSSRCKYSSYTFDNKTYYLGALECILKDNNNFSEYYNYSKEYRTIALVENETIIAYILLQDEIRKEAKDTISYLKKQNINIKIISGDNVKTIENISKRCGIDQINSINMTNIKLEEIYTIVEKYNVFGRVTPEQKKRIIIELKKSHKVGMTGDGVNDVLALKEADISIAMGTGSDAARNVSKLILLDSNFDAIPHILKEGRRTINNIERSASLFLTKTIYSFLLSILFLFLNYKYPFIPIQLTVISFFTIGIPSLVLALEPNDELVKGNFISNIFKKSLPTALVLVINIILIMIITTIFKFSYSYSSTLTVIISGLVGFILLYKISIPFNKIRSMLITLLFIGFISSILIFNKFLSLTNLNIYMIALIVSLFFFSIANFIIISDFCSKLIDRHMTKEV